MICSPLQNVTNGYVTYPTNRSEGSIASYGCDEEFVLVGNETRICQSDSMWSNDEPGCGELGFYTYIFMLTLFLNNDIFKLQIHCHYVPNFLTLPMVEW